MVAVSVGGLPQRFGEEWRGMEVLDAIRTRRMIGACTNEHEWAVPGLLVANGVSSCRVLL